VTRAAAGGGRRPTTVVGVLASCGIVVSLMHTLVVPLLPAFPALLDTAPGTVAWLVTSTLLSGAICAPVLGRPGDMDGKRRMLLVALALMSLGSALGAVSSEFAVVLAARALQDTALGVIPLGISIMRDLLPEEKVMTGTALMSATLGTGGAVGLPLAGRLAVRQRHVGGGVPSGRCCTANLLLLIAVTGRVPRAGRPLSDRSRRPTGMTAGR
jgi:MFS family permease